MHLIQMVSGQQWRPPEVGVIYTLLQTDFPGVSVLTTWLRLVEGRGEGKWQGGGTEKGCLNATALDSHL